jgi:16S rRNA (uracil1498-N3)-methyltransferase
MAHLHRFYLPEDYSPGVMIPLPEAEAHHALRVARIRAGQELELFDGHGGAARATLEPTGKREAAAVITEVLPAQSREPEFTLLVAWLHRDAAIEELIKRGTEIGVTRFAFFKAARSEQPPKIAAKHERLAVEACKQCGRNWIPEIVVAPDALAETGPGACIAALTPDAKAVSTAPQGAHTLIVGPEGDFTPQEVEQFLAAGATAVTLGPCVYRTEVAAILGATLLLSARGAFGLGQAD